MATKTQKAAIQPDVVYPLTVWRLTSGLGRNSEARARRKGIHLPVLHIGRSKYIKGSDGIRFMMDLAEAGM